MRSSCRNIVILSAAAITVAAALLLWPRRCPVAVVILSTEPSGMVDDAGAEYALAYVALTNHGHAAVLMDAMSAEAEVKGSRVTAPQPWAVGGIGRYGQIEGPVLIPDGAKAYRLNFRYALRDHWQLRVLNWAGKRFPGVYGIGVVGPALGRRHDELSRNPQMRHQTRWRAETVEIRLEEP
jgi:hypothetical protein